MAPDSMPVSTRSIGAAIAAAIDLFVNNPDLARAMGENRREAALAKYNWPAQASQLVSFMNRGNKRCRSCRSVAPGSMQRRGHRVAFFGELLRDRKSVV